MSGPTEDVRGDSPDVVARHLEQGTCTFMGLEFEVGPGSLVPRRETELLARAALLTIAAELDRPDAPSDPVVVDLCCGVGNLAITIATAFPGVRVVATDLSHASVLLAARNAARHGVADRVLVLEGDLFEPLAALRLTGRVLAIVCNPPYISTSRLAGERRELLELEPREAFDGGPYGLSIHQRAAREAPRWLRPNGVLMFEYGAGQAKQVSAVIDRVRCYAPAELFRDRTDEPRALRARLRSEVPGA